MSKLIPTKDELEQMRLHGFEEMFVHNIPQGVVITPEMWKDLPLMPTGTYFNPEKDLIIEEDLFFEQKDPQWRMITTYNGIRSNGQWFFSKNGDIIELLKASLELAKR